VPVSNACVQFFSFAPPPSWGGHGGNRRLLQILDVFARHGITHHLEALSQPAEITDKLKHILIGALPCGNVPISRFQKLHSLYQAGRARTAIPSKLLKTPHLFAFDTLIPLYSPNFSRIRSTGGKIILLPQDLDSLCPQNRHPFSNSVTPRWLKSEIDMLAKGHVVCCISREEQWLLSIHGIDALYLPYYPPGELGQALRLVRARRKDVKEKNIVLVLGSANHAPTSLGLIALKPVLHAIPKVLPGLSVAVVGFGTQKYKAFLETEGVSVLGAVPPDFLDDLMGRSKCAIANQAPTSGALTRVCDLLVAGIPIIANHHASRSYHNVNGVHTVESLDQIIPALESLGPDDPDMPPSPTTQEALLARAILSL
jgi:hypothetical protein